MKIAFDENELDHLADLLYVRLSSRLDTHVQRGADQWMTTAEAAAYLGQTVNALHKLTSAREIPFSQTQKGARCWFRRSDLDAWRAQSSKGLRPS